MARDTLLTYPHFGEKNKIHNGDSLLQLGAFIVQRGKPISFHS